MARPTCFGYERMRVYRMQTIVCGLVRRITADLPQQEGSLAQILDNAGLTLMLKIVRGCGDQRRSEARRHFREARRAAQLCESCVIGLSQSGAGKPLDRSRAIRLLVAIQENLNGIVARIDSGMSRSDAMQGA